MFVCLLSPDKIKDRDKDENFQMFRATVDKLAESSASLETASLEDTIQRLVADTVKQHETTEIEEQKKVSQWTISIMHKKKITCLLNK